MWLADLQEQARRRLEDAASLQSRVAQVRATASDRSGTVTVTVDATGHLLDVQYASVGDLTPERLRTATLEVVAARAAGDARSCAPPRVWSERSRCRTWSAAGSRRRPARRSRASLARYRDDAGRDAVR
ncbi:YbaB/EbfC family nucleoid-associated protein [Cellulomonas gelida]|uniref:YbaB/EbfC family nucleoid-associated protein n=1 Tax=Cellulomonas gelida TaxID=1712 RepID=UPI00360A778F